jgi:uncharacterized protein YaaN involved in tellurite resistance
MTAEEEKTLRAVITMLEHMSEHANEYRQQLSQYVALRDAA